MGSQSRRFVGLVVVAEAEVVVTDGVGFVVAVGVAVDVLPRIISNTRDDDPPVADGVDDVEVGLVGRV